MCKVEKLLELIVKTGLSTYKAKNSSASLPAFRVAAKEDKLHKKGAVFVVSSKEHFTDKGVKGYILTSKESLFEDFNEVTHWTPNVYGVYGYTDDTKRFIRGFEEGHLNQINAFVLDIDTKKHTPQDILMTCLDDSVGSPTAIIESERGYQVYFVLDKPIFLTNKSNKAITVAKRISDNLKRSLSAVDVDMYCNDFGFFRMPKESNLVWFNENALYSTGELITFSKRQDDNMERSLFVVHSNLTVNNVLTADWFHALVTATDVKGEKGQIGRNNLLFTLALVCLQSGKSESDTFDLVDQVNSNFKRSLKGNQLHVIVKSAYSGKYKGAKKEYVESLLQLYVGGNHEVKLGNSGWYKFKKARSERERSHYNEWENDIITHIESNAQEGFVSTTQKELTLKLGIPQSTLNMVLKDSKVILKRVVGKGKGSRTFLTTVATFIKYALEKTREQKIMSSKGLRAFIDQYIFENAPAVKELEVYVEKVETERKKIPDNLVFLFGDSS